MRARQQSAEKDLQALVSFISPTKAPARSREQSGSPHLPMVIKLRPSGSCPYSQGANVLHVTSVTLQGMYNRAHADINDTREARSYVHHLQDNHRLLVAAS